jgi:hypothetical protein
LLPQDPNGTADPVYGIREFVVGTGGENLYDFEPPEPNSEVREGTTPGVLKLTLNPGGYAWEFIPIAGKTFSDQGSGSCSTTPNPNPTPTSSATPNPRSTPTPFPTPNPNNSDHIFMPVITRK